MISHIGARLRQITSPSGHRGNRAPYGIMIYLAVFPLICSIFNCLVCAAAFVPLGIAPGAVWANFRSHLLYAYTSTFDFIFLLPLALFHIAVVNAFLFRLHADKRPAVFVGLIAFSDLCLLFLLAQFMGWQNICSIPLSGNSSASFLLALPLAGAVTSLYWLWATNAPHANRRAMRFYTIALVVLELIFATLFVFPQWGEGYWNSNYANSKGDIEYELDEYNHSDLIITVPDLAGKPLTYCIPVTWKTKGRSFTMVARKPDDYESSRSYGKENEKRVTFPAGTLLARGTAAPGLREMDLQVTLPDTPPVHFRVVRH